MSNSSSTERKDLVYMGKNSTIRMKPYNFSMISNSLIYDKTLSAKAKGIYIMMCAECQRANYQENRNVTKGYIASLSTDGEASFETGWKELKKAGYLKQTKKQGEAGKWVYEYELLTEPENISFEDTISEENKPHPENHPLEPHPDFPPLENHPVNKEEESNNVLYGIVNENQTPSFEEIQDICKSLNSEESAKEVFNDLTKQDFKDNEGKPIANLKAYVQGILTNKAYNESRKKERRNKEAYIQQSKKNTKINKIPDVTNPYKTEKTEEDEESFWEEIGKYSNAKEPVPEHQISEKKMEENRKFIDGQFENLFQEISV